MESVGCTVSAASVLARLVAKNNYLPVCLTFLHLSFPVFLYSANTLQPIWPSKSVPTEHLFIIFLFQQVWSKIGNFISLRLLFTSSAVVETRQDKKSHRTKASFYTCNPQYSVDFFKFILDGSSDHDAQLLLTF